MSGGSGPDQGLIDLQKAQNVELREKEREEKLSKGARDRNLRNARNARSRNLLTAIAQAGVGSVDPRGA